MTPAYGPSKVMKNIFRLATDYERSPEDRFTAAWGYVLHRERQLAQVVADIVLKASGVADEVISVTDHPACNSTKIPDFCIECVNLNILVEHKLDATLHENQLESYLDILILEAIGRPHKTTYVAFIAPAYQAVPSAVLTNPHYLKPQGEDHFRWSDFYEAVKSQPGWLTQEFAEYMSSLGMAPFMIKGPEDIFDARTKPTQFSAALKMAATQVFAIENDRNVIRGTPGGRGVEIRTPRESITLIYVRAEQRSIYLQDLEIPAALEVYVYERSDAERRDLPESVSELPSGRTIRRHRLAKPLQQGLGQCRYVYAAPITEIIENTREETIQRMVEMLKVVRADFWPLSPA